MNSFHQKESLNKASEQVASESLEQEEILAKESEEGFLSTYSIKDYERPSVATDIAVFSMFKEAVESHRRDDESKLHILLIKRGEHPFKNKWALPGGFLKPDETVEECAIRETKEETNVSPVSILPVGIFSEPNRDPRGRIVSAAYASIVNAENVKVMGGTDAVNAKWFWLEFKRENNGVFKLHLSSDEEEISLELKEKESKFSNSRFEIISNDGLAFDHGIIIADALSVLKRQAEEYLIAFDFLPEKFTLADLQRVQETLLGISLLTANFRRKIADLVEETDEYTEGVGHRPARLYKKRG